MRSLKTPLFDRLRLRYGLLWKRKFPLPSLRIVITLALLATIVFLYVRVWGYENIIPQLLETAQQAADCANNGYLGYYMNNKGYGHGRTYLKCQITEVDV